MHWVAPAKDAQTSALEKTLSDRADDHDKDSVEDARLAACLDALAPHVDGDEMALTGGVAMARHVAGARTRLADIDLVARRMEAVRATVTRTFLVSHYHVAGEGVKRAIVQLVHPATRLRVDVFPDRLAAVERATITSIGRGTWRVVAAADLLTHKRSLSSAPVDPKHWRDALLLCALLGEPPPPTPRALVPDVYTEDIGIRCDRCTRSASPAFPLAPKRAILELLGYV